jgi:hypothetical protein
MTSDDELRAKLRSLDTVDRDSELGRERADALHARIMAGARLTLESRHQRTIWDYSARWALTAVPLALAASIVAAMLLLRAPRTSDNVEAPTTVAYESADDPSAVMRSLASGQAVSADMLDSLIGPMTRDALASRVFGGSQ